MPWPPRLFSPPTLPILALVPLLLAAFLPHPPLLPYSSAATISYADGQPEYPSQPEVTSDRNALARIFLQSLIEKEANSRNPHGFAYGEEPDGWSGSGFSSKRSNADDPYRSYRYSSLKDVHPNLRYAENARGYEDGYDDEFDSLPVLEPDREKILTELLARGHPYAALHGDGIFQPPELTDDDQNTRLNQLARLAISNQADPTDDLRDDVNRHRSSLGSSPLFKNKRSRYSWNKRDPFGINARGFHDDVFYRDFGSFQPMKRMVRSADGKGSAEEEVEEAQGEKGNLGGVEQENKTHTTPMGVEQPKALPKTEEPSLRRSKRSTENTSPEPAEAKEGKILKREERAADGSDSPFDSAQLESKRRPEMDSSGFHGDTFNSGFGDFWTMKRSPLHEQRPLGRYTKRRPEMDSSGFHGDTFNSGFGDFWTMKRSQEAVSLLPGHAGKRRPEMDSSGFHGDTFSGGFGDFYTMKRAPAGSSAWGPLREGKRRPEMDSSGFHGDTFNSGFGDFWTMKRSQGLPYPQGFSSVKRRPEMDSSGFHGDTFNSGFGDFWTMKRNGHPWTESRGSGGGAKDLDVGKRRPEMDSSGFHGDTFNSGFGDFWTMKRDLSTTPQHPRIKRDLGRQEKRRPEMDSSGFHGDTFNSGFGDFWTMKRSEGGHPRWPMGRMETKRRPEMDSSGFHGDTFNSGFGDFWTMKRGHFSPYPSHFTGVKRRPEMDSSGFHGDTFNGGFGDFWTMKRSDGLGPLLLHPSKRKPEMDSSGFHGDTFNGGFGDFWTMKRGSGLVNGLGKLEKSGMRSEEEKGRVSSSSSDPHDGVHSGVFAGALEGKKNGEDRVKSDKDAGPPGESTSGGKTSNKFDNTKK